MAKQRKHKLNGRQLLFIGYYCEGETKGNCYASMIKAGYSELYSLHTNTKILEFAGIAEAIKKRLNEILDFEEVTIEVLTRKYKQQYQACIVASDRVNAQRCLENLSKHVGYYEKDNRQQDRERPTLTDEERAILQRDAVKLTNTRRTA